MKDENKPKYSVKEYDNKCVFILKVENGKTYEAKPIPPLEWNEIGDIEYRNFNL